MTSLTRLIGIKEVINKTSLSQSTIYKAISEGLFPPPVPILSKRNTWLESEIDEWINEQVNRRNCMTDLQRKDTLCF